MAVFDLDKLSRVTSSQKFIPEIDGLRFIAIATVVLYHLRTSILRQWQFSESALNDNLFFEFLSKGGLGVNLFFTISGFILALPFVKQFVYGDKPVKIGNYFLRRLTRLEPPYIIIMTVLFIVQVAAQISGLRELFPHYIASLLYVHFFVYGSWSMVNPVAWSLETEVQFYIVAPLIASVYRLRKHAIRFMLYAIVIAIHLFIIVEYTRELSDLHLIKSIVYYFSNFFLGFMLADAFLLLGLDKAKTTVVHDLAGIAGLLLLFYSYFRSGWLDHVTFCMATVLVFWAAFRGRFFNKIMRNRVVATIGGMCYTIYLIHYVFLFVMVKLLAALLPFAGSFYGIYAVSFIVLIPLLLILSAVVFYYIEKPFMYPKWYNRLIGIKP